MKVALINPPQDQLAQPDAYIPLGLAYIGAVLEKDGHNVVTSNGITIPEADVYGITCVSATYQSALAVRKKIDHGMVVVGGIHPTIAPNETLFEFRCDHVIEGEGEYAFRDLLRLKRNPENTIAKPIIHAGYIQDIDALPLPARHIFPRDHVVDCTGIHGQEKGEGATTMITSRGCPFDCNFCTRIPQTRKVRLHSPDRMIAEMNHVMDEYPVSHFRFVDDMFAVRKDRVMKFCEGILGDHLNHDATWICITRADSLDKELVRNMKKAGCTEIHIGVESGSNRVLELMNKKTTVDVLEKGVKMIKDAGIRAKTYIMYGFEGETDADRAKTIAFVKRAKPDKVTVSHFTPLRGSRMWAEASHEDSNWFYPEDDPGYKRFKEEIHGIVEDDQ
jgi:anaerobic magnesium-protoporphyrin IX monomethyl ester cyclase